MQDLHARLSALESHLSPSQLCFESIMHEACMAHDALQVEDKFSFPCGMTVIKVPHLSKNPITKRFIAWLVENNHIHLRDRHRPKALKDATIRLTGKSMTQSYDINLASCQAFLKVLEKHGIQDFYLRSWVD